MITRLFTPDRERYDGVRPINIYLLRLIYFLIAAFVATDAWTTVLRHHGPWDPVRAVAWCAWAAYSTLCVLGLIHPLRMLPIMVFVVFYKVLWLAVVAFPLWRAGTLIGSSAEELTRVFMWVPLLMIAVPWKYVFQQYVMPARNRSVAKDRIVALHQAATGD